MAAADLTFKADVDVSKLINDLKKAVNQMETIFKNVDGLDLDIDPSALDKAKQSADKISRSLDDVARSGKAAEETWDRQARGIKEAGTQATTFDKKLDQVDDGLQKIARSGGLATNAINFAAVAGGVQALADAADAVQGPFLKLDTQIKNIGTLGVENFEQFTDLTLELSKRVPDDAATIAEATYNAISAGIQGTNEEIIAFVEKASQAAVAGVSDVGTSVNALTSVLNAYKIPASEVASVNDTFFAAIKLGKTSFGEMAAGLANVIPAASAAGIEFKEVAGTIAQMTALGVPTAQATTQIRQAIIELQKPAKPLEQVMNAAGLSIENIGAVIREQGLVATLQQVEGAATSMGKSLPQVFGSAEAASAALLVTGDNAKRASETLAAVDREIANNAAGKAFEVAAEGAEVQSKILGNRIQAFFTGIFSGLGTQFNAFLGALTNFAPVLSALAGVAVLGNNAIGVFFKMRQEGVTVGQVVGKVATQFKAAAASALNFGKTALKSMFSLKGAAVGAAAGIALILFATEEGQAAMQEIGQTLSEAFAPLVTAFVPVIKTITAAIVPLIDTVARLLSQVLLNIVDSIAGVIADVGAAFGQLLQIVVPLAAEIIKVITPILDTVTNLIGGAFSNVAGALNEIANVIATIGTDVLKAVTPLIEVATSTLLPLFTELATQIGAVFSKVGRLVAALVQSLVPVITSFVEAIKPIATTVVTIITQVLSLLAGGITQVLTSVLPVISKIVETIGQLLGGVARSLVPVLSTLANTLASLLSGVLGTVVETLGGVVAQLVPVLTGLFDAIGPALNAIGMVLRNVLGTILGGLVQSLAPILGTLSEAIGQIAQVLGGALSAAVTALAPVITTLASAFGSIVDVLGGALASLVEGLAPIIGLIGNLVSQVAGLLAPVLEQVGGIISKLATVIGGTLSAVITAIVPVIETLGGVLGRIITVVTGVVSTIITALTPVLSVITDLIGRLVPIIGNLVGSLLNALAPAIEAVVGIIGQLLGIAAGLIETIVTALEPVITRLADIFAQIVGVIADVAVLLVSALTPVLEVVAEVVAQVVGALGQGLGEILTALTPLLNLLAEGLATVVEFLADGLLVTLDFLTPILVELVALLGEGLTTTVSFLAPIISELAKIIGDVLTVVIDALVVSIEWLVGAIVDVAEWIGGAASDAFNFFVGIVNDVVDTVESFIGAIGDAAETVVDFVENIPLIGDIVTGIGDAVDFVGDTVGDAIDGIGSFFGGASDRIDEAARKTAAAGSNSAGAVAQAFGQATTKIVAHTAQAEAAAQRLIDKLFAALGLQGQITTGEEDTDTPPPPPPPPPGGGEKTDPFDKAIAEVDASEAKRLRDIAEVYAEQRAAIRKDETLSEEDRAAAFEAIKLGEQEAITATEKSFAEKRLKTAREFEKKGNEKAKESLVDLETKLISLGEKAAGANEELFAFFDESLLGVIKEVNDEIEKIEDAIKPVRDFLKEIRDELGESPTVDFDLDKYLDTLTDTYSFDASKILALDFEDPKAVDSFIADTLLEGGEDTPELTRLRDIARTIGDDFKDGLDFRPARDNLNEALTDVEQGLADRLKAIDKFLAESLISEEQAAELRLLAQREANKLRADELEKFVDEALKIQEGLTKKSDDNLTLFQRSAAAGIKAFTDAVTGARKIEGEASAERQKEIKLELALLKKSFEAGETTSHEFVKRTDELAREMGGTIDEAANAWDRFKDAGLAALGAVKDSMASFADESLGKVTTKTDEAFEASIKAIVGVTGAKEESDKKLKEASEQSTDAFLAGTAAAGAGVIDAIANGQNALKATQEGLKEVAQTALQAFVPQIAGFLSFLGPFAVPAAILATRALSSFISSIDFFEKGGVIEGGPQFIGVNERGTESVLNASATSALGKSTIDAINLGKFAVDPLGNIVLNGRNPQPIVLKERPAVAANRDLDDYIGSSDNARTAAATEALVTENRLLREQVKRSDEKAARALDKLDEIRKNTKTRRRSTYNSNM